MLCIWKYTYHITYYGMQNTNVGTGRLFILQSFSSSCSDNKSSDNCPYRVWYKEKINLSAWWASWETNVRLWFIFNTRLVMLLQIDILAQTLRWTFIDIPGESKSCGAVTQLYNCHSRGRGRGGHSACLLGSLSVWLSNDTAGLIYLQGL